MSTSLSRSNKKAYTDEDLIKALAEIKSNQISARAASKKYNIPRATLGDKITGAHTSCVKGKVYMYLYKLSVQSKMMMRL